MSINFNNNNSQQSLNILPKRPENVRLPQQHQSSAFLNSSKDQNNRRRRHATDPPPRSSSNNQNNRQPNGNHHQVRLIIPKENNNSRQNHHQRPKLHNNNKNSSSSIPSNRSRPNGGPSNRHRAHRTHTSSSSSSNQSSLSAIDVLRKLLDSRWNASSKLLDLAGLAQDRILKAGGIAAPGIKGAPLKTASAIWKLCQEMYPDVESISLADNNLRSLQPMSMSSLVATLPNLVNLSLAGNQLESISDLNTLSPLVGGVGVNNSQKQGLNQLREIILLGNPVRLNAEKEGQAGLQQYLFELCRRFPSLQVLDGEAIDPNLKASLNLNSINNSNGPLIQNDLLLRTSDQNLMNYEPPMPLAIQPAFLSDQSTSSFAAAFCLQYFSAFDQDRDSLIDVYATKSSFSLCAASSIPIRSKRAGLTRNQPGMPAQQNPSWTEYLNISRNNAKLKGNRLSERIAEGPAEIISFLKKIPRTKHPLSLTSSSSNPTSTNDQQKFVVDSYQIPGLVNESTSTNGVTILLNVHGEFQEFPSLTIRSFDRSFILGGAGPASAATLKGWPCVILSDQLTIRSYSSPTAWKPRSINQDGNSYCNDASKPTENQNGPNQIVEGLTIEQQGLISRLMGITKLNEKYSIECLVQNGWDFGLAVKNFEEINRIGKLPLEAFIG